MPIKEQKVLCGLQQWVRLFALVEHSVTTQQPAELWPGLHLACQKDHSQTVCPGRCFGKEVDGGGPAEQANDCKGPLKRSLEEQASGLAWGAAHEKLLTAEFGCSVSCCRSA